jgi:hypothetical protein
MTNQGKLLLRSIAVVALGITAFAKTPTLTGKMVAYDPLLHAAKVATFVANKEEVILEIPGPKTKFVKVVVVGFGTTQIDPKYFDGTTPFVVQALRDRTCDEKSPKLVAEMGTDQKSGIYLMTEAYKNTPTPDIKTLECYEATGKK